MKCALLPSIAKKKPRSKRPTLATVKSIKRFGCTLAWTNCLYALCASPLNLQCVWNCHFLFFTSIRCSFQNYSVFQHQSKHHENGFRVGFLTFVWQRFWNCAIGFSVSCIDKNIRTNKWKKKHKIKSKRKSFISMQWN